MSWPSNSVRAEADRLAGMLDAPNLGGGIGRFLTERTFAATTPAGCGCHR